MHRYSEEEGSSPDDFHKAFSVDLHNVMVGRCHASYPQFKDSFIAGLVLVAMIVRVIGPARTGASLLLLSYVHSD